MQIVHLMTQGKPPYGSVRRCCERCGEMILPFTDQVDTFNALPMGYVRCDAVKETDGVN
jgi:hypothetical protein